MATRKKKKAIGRTSWFENLRQSATVVSPNSFLGFVLVVGVVAGLYYGWQLWGRDALARVDRSLAAENLEVTPQPPWIEVSVANEAYQDGSLSELSLLDKELTLKIYGAFEMHRWVARVDSVGKQPGGGVVVDLHYRQPVAWVEVPASMTESDLDSILPIDVQGVLLPPEELKHRVAEFPPRISVSSLSPWPHRAGLPWKDARVSGAAMIASLLADSWRELRLNRIKAYSVTPDDNQEGFFLLETASGKEIEWGRAPGKEQPNEPLAADKVERLRQHASQYGLSDPSREIDLRWGSRSVDTSLNR